MSKAKSSIHFAKGAEGYFSHNDRSTPTKNSIFNDEKNEVSCSAIEAFKVYREELSKRAEAYTARTGQKLQKNAVTHRSAILNLHAHHTLQDLQPIINKIEKDLDTKVLQVAIHRDEGHIDDKGEAVKNIHAHLEIMGLDSNGISLAQNSFGDDNKKKRKRLDSTYYRELQDFVAKTLKMERGKVNSKAKRLDTYEYKNHKEKEAKTVKELKAEFELFRKKMLNKNKELENKVYSKEDYQALSKLKKQLKKSNLVEIYEEFDKLKHEARARSKRRSNRR